MRNTLRHKDRRFKGKGLSPLLTATAIAVIMTAGVSAYAQNDVKPPEIHNPKSAWVVTDKATDTTPYCLMSRGYNPEISIQINSDAAGRTTLSVKNHPEGLARITNVSVDGHVLTNIAPSKNLLTAEFSNTNEELEHFYTAESVIISDETGRAFSFPIQSTTVAQAKMALCVSVIDKLKNIDAMPIVSEIAPPSDDLPMTVQDMVMETADSNPIMSEELSAPTPSDDMDDVAALIDRVSNDIEAPKISAEDVIEQIDAPLPLAPSEVAMTGDSTEVIDDISTDLTTEMPVNTEAEAIDIVAPDAAMPELEMATPKDNADEFVNMAQAMEQDALSQTPQLAAAPIQEAVTSNEEAYLDVESLIDESLPALNDAPQAAEMVAEEQAPIIEMADEELQPESIIEDFAAEEQAAAIEVHTADIMNDSDILNALEDSLGAAQSNAQNVTAAPADDYPSDIPLDDLATLASPAASAALVAPTDTTDAATDIDSLIDESITETALTPEAVTESAEAAAAPIETTDTASLDDVQSILDEVMTDAPAETPEASAETASALPSADALFGDDLSLDIEDDTSVSANEDENIVDELADEDFSDEELIALLDDPDALAEDFTEIMVQEEFKQVKPMEGIRDMLGLGTPEDIEYRKVPWLMEEDIDAQWKEKVKMLEREKEMLRLKLADTKANPLADLIATKRNKRTQEELIEKIRALELENEKLKKGLVLSKTPEEFLGEDLKISDPKSGMRIGAAATSKIDLIDDEVESDLSSLETRMDSFLNGVGEDYALANPEKVSPLSASSLTQDIINILIEGYVVDPDALKIRAYRHKATGTAVTAWEAGDLDGRAERTVLPPNSSFNDYVERFLKAAQLRCNGNFTAVPDESTRNLKTLDIHCNDGGLGQRSSVIFVRHGSIITAIATTTNLPKGDADFLRDIRKRIIEGIRVMDKKRT